jgi:hypothetical protein
MSRATLHICTDQNIFVIIHIFIMHDIIFARSFVVRKICMDESLFDWISLYKVVLCP